MPENEKVKYSCRITVRYRPAEVEKLTKLTQASTCRKVSEYIRKVSLQKPVTVQYRNQSADDFLAEMIQLKNELSAIGRNLNQAVHKLHILDAVPHIHSWAVRYESQHQVILQKAEEIKQKMVQIYEQWSLK